MQNRTVLHVGVLRLISTSIDVPLDVCDVRSSNGSGTRLRLRQERWSGSDAWAVDNLYVCDCSVMPDAWGLPPTFTLVALGKRLARHLARQ